MVVEASWSNLTNLLAFVAITFSAYINFYLSQKTQALNIFILANGLNLIGFSHIFRIWDEAIFFTILTLALGSILILTSTFMFFYQRSYDRESLKKRYREIKSIMSNLKQKYYKQEISEEDFKSATLSLVKELAEIEVKLKEKKGKRR